MSSSDTPTQLLIQSNKADTMKVRSRDGDAIGYVYSYMINKRTGEALYAVLTIGGFLGMGKAYYPLPFQLLSYDAANDSYQVTIDRRVLEGGPSWANNAPLFDQAYADRVASYYDVAREDLSLGGPAPAAL
ncbi:PRC-barrel domain-containing protein [Sphingomonas aracearum]|uniref:PRC-barrel domain containing protein n=1 Tax=Sphingomonas aracearum TaxID=2283317 RepID=A0A369VYB5_9SPHN|nr:PRC-barrel domain-containing protein [Sphingomonas aracearum]RDE07123.1 PRC-barrel domain containing protein [Sphingomonas aracearum]